MGRLLLFSPYNNRCQICLGPWIQTWYLDHFGFGETLRDQMELNGSIWKYDVNMMWIWCEYDVNMIWIWCEYDVNMMWLWCEYDVNMMWIWCEYDVKYDVKYDGSMMNGVSCHTRTPFWSMLTMLTLHIRIQNPGSLDSIRWQFPGIPFLPMEPQLDPSKNRWTNPPYGSVEGGEIPSAQAAEPKSHI